MNLLASSSTSAPVRVGLIRSGFRGISHSGISNVGMGRPVLSGSGMMVLGNGRSVGVSRLSTNSPLIPISPSNRTPTIRSSIISTSLQATRRRGITTSAPSLLSSTAFTRLPSPSPLTSSTSSSLSTKSKLNPNSNPNPNPQTQFDPDPNPEPEAEAEAETEDPNAPPQSAMSRLKLLFKRYGWYALGMYTILSALDFSLTFALIHLAGLERMEPLIRAVVNQYRVVRFGGERAGEMKAEDEKLRIEEKSDGGKKKKKDNNNKEGSSRWISKTVLAEMALAYPIHKVALLPVRAGLTVAWTPKFVGWLTRRGWVGKGGYTRAATHAQDKIRTAKERVKERVKDIRE